METPLPALPPTKRQRLLDAARTAARRSHVPFSKLPCGAAILTVNGAVYMGCAVEISNWASSFCAPKAALAAAIVAGDISLLAIAISGGGPDSQYLCGDCRQTLFEFSRNLIVIVDGLDGEDRTLADLLPNSFSLRENAPE